MNPHCWICPERVEDDDAATVHIECADGIKPAPSLDVERLAAAILTEFPHLAMSPTPIMKRVQRILDALASESVVAA